MQDSCVSFVEGNKTRSYGTRVVCVSLLILPHPPFFFLSSQGLGIVPSAEAPYASAGEGISNVRIPRVDQNGSSLSFSVTWADGGGVGGTEGTSELVDIWLTAKQVDPAAWVELPLLQVGK